MKKIAFVAVVLVGVVAAVLWYLRSDQVPSPAAARMTPVQENTSPVQSNAAPVTKKEFSSVPHGKAGAASAREETPLPALVDRVRGEIQADHAEWVPTLEKVLSTSETERAEAVRELGFIEDPRFLRPIIRLLQVDPDADVRSAAAGALEQHDSAPEATYALVGALKDGEEEVRKNALLSLAVHRNSLVQSELRRSLESGSLDGETRESVKLFLDQYYVRKDPFRDPLRD